LEALTALSFRVKKSFEGKKVIDEERVETHPSHMKKIEGIQEIKIWLLRWMQKDITHKKCI